MIDRAFTEFTRVNDMAVMGNATRARKQGFRAVIRLARKLWAIIRLIQAAAELARVDAWIFINKRSVSEKAKLSSCNPIRIEGLRAASTYRI